MSNTELTTLVAGDSLVFEVTRDGDINMCFPDGVDPKTAHPVWTIVSFLLSEKLRDKAWTTQIMLEMTRWTPTSSPSRSKH